MKKKTSWNPVAQWYDQLLTSKGSYFHEEVILPKMAEKLQKGAICDLGCGQGILLEKLGKKRTYLGIDIAPNLIKAAQKRFGTDVRFLVKDITHPLAIDEQFDHVVSILAIQNIDPLPAFLANCRALLKEGGSLHIVMNHPCFRIPRQSSWGDDAANKIQYRRIDRYMSPMAIPIQMHPGKKEKSEETLSFHRPLHLYFSALSDAGFAVQALEEWISPKKSEGSTAKKEDRARSEIPLFLYLRAKSIS